MYIAWLHFPITLCLCVPPKFLLVQQLMHLPLFTTDSGNSILPSHNGIHATLLESQDTNCRSPVTKPPHQKASHDHVTCDLKDSL